MRLTRLEIQGFRSFGPEITQIDFEGEFSVIYGPNSQGKTSLAEAVEFLLTGATARREIVSSAVREFRDALRNAHLEEGHGVFVRGFFQTVDGTTRVVERRLERDYGGQGSCASTLLVDGAVEDSIEAIGMSLAQPPIAAPVLMQHTLRHVISAGPQARTEYFRALLEVSDVIAIRDSVADATALLADPCGDIAGPLEECVANETLREALSPILGHRPTQESVATCVRQCLIAFLHHFNAELPGDENELRPAAERLLADLRAHAFPLAGLARHTGDNVDLPPLSVPPGNSQNGPHGLVRR